MKENRSGGPSMVRVRSVIFAWVSNAFRSNGASNFGRSCPFSVENVNVSSLQKLRRKMHSVSESTKLSQSSSLVISEAGERTFTLCE